EREIRIAGAASVLRCGKQWRGERHIAGGNAHHAVRLAGSGIDAVDTVRRNVAVPEKPAAVANAAAAILDGVVLAVILNWAVIRDVTGGDLEVTAEKLAEPGDLPAADQGIGQATRVSAQQFAL